jgi:hypothetical protein
MYLKSTAGRQISTLIFGFGGGTYTYPMKNYRRTAKFFATWVLRQRYCPVLYLTEVPKWDNAPQSHSRVSNINFDTWIWGGGRLYISHEHIQKDG